MKLGLTGAQDLHTLPDMARFESNVHRLSLPLGDTRSRAHSLSSDLGMKGCQGQTSRRAVTADAGQNSRFPSGRRVCQANDSNNAGDEA